MENLMVYRFNVKRKVTLFKLWNSQSAKKGDGGYETTKCFKAFVQRLVGRDLILLIIAFQNRRRHNRTYQLLRWASQNPR
jgi:hypothetical protein